MLGEDLWKMVSEGPEEALDLGGAIRREPFEPCEVAREQEAGQVGRRPASEQVREEVEPDGIAAHPGRPLPASLEDEDVGTYHDLHSALWKLGVKLRRPDGLDAA